MAIIENPLGDERAFFLLRECISYSNPSSCFLLDVQLVIMRSATMAMKAIDNPATIPRPGAALLSAIKTSCPRPLVPTSAVITNMLSAIMIVWFRPSRISGNANGNCTIHRTCRSVQPTRTIIRRAKRSIVLADHSKFGRRALVSVCDFHEIDMLITDQVPTDSIYRRLEEEGVTICAGSESELKQKL